MHQKSKNLRYSEKKRKENKKKGEGKTRKAKEESPSFCPESYPAIEQVSASGVRDLKIRELGGPYPFQLSPPF